MLTSEHAALEAVSLVGDDKEERLIDPSLREDTVPLGVLLAMTSGMGGYADTPTNPLSY